MILPLLFSMKLFIKTYPLLRVRSWYKSLVSVGGNNLLSLENRLLPFLFSAQSLCNVSKHSGWLCRWFKNRYSTRWRIHSRDAEEPLCYLYARQQKRHWCLRCALLVLSKAPRRLNTESASNYPAIQASKDSSPKNLCWNYMWTDHIPIHPG